jgi:bacteriocin-like protein
MLLKKFYQQFLNNENMENLIELNNTELKNISGGTTFAYRVGQCIRWAGLSTMPGGWSSIGIEMEYCN